MIEEIKTYDTRKKELIEEGKKKGFVTYEQLASALKGLELDSDSLDDLYNSLMEANIQVVTDEDDVGSEEGDADGSFDELLKDSTLAKELTINDPVRMYLKEIGKISLLSLEQETELSKRTRKKNRKSGCFGIQTFIIASCLLRTLLFLCS